MQVADFKRKIANCCCFTIKRIVVAMEGLSYRGFIGLAIALVKIKVLKGG